MTKILIIDDDINTTWLLEKLFSQEGYEVISNNTSVNALSIALSTKPDLILLDLTLLTNLTATSLAIDLSKYNILFSSLTQGECCTSS